MKCQADKTNFVAMIDEADGTGSPAGPTTCLTVEILGPGEDS